MGRQEAEAEVAVEHIGGISETEVEIPPGVTVLAGRNATNRTSLLRAIMAAVGSDNVSLKSDQPRGRVELRLDGETYTRTLSRRDGDVVIDGEPYTHDPTLADLFAFLLESNEARQAIERGGDLYDVIMRPVDTEEIEAQIRRIRDALRDLDRRLGERESVETRLTDLEGRRRQLSEKLDQVEDALEEKRSEIEPLGIDPTDPGFDDPDHGETFEELYSTRERLGRTTDRIDVESQAIEALEDEVESLEAELVEAPDDIEARIASLETEIGGLRDRARSVDAEINRLATLIEFNDDFVDEPPRPLLASQKGERDTRRSVTDALVEGDSTVCWTCGSDVELDAIQETIEALRELRTEKIEERRGYHDRIDELEHELDTLRGERARSREIERSLEDARAELEERRSRRTDLLERRERLEADVEDLEAEIEGIGGAYAEALEAHRELADLEVERDRFEAERDSVIEEIEALESELAELDAAAEDRDRQRDRMEELQSRIGEIEREAVDEFNEQIEEVIGILDYENIARVWLERLETDTATGSNFEKSNTFELHLVRQNDAGEVYEDHLENLSESERAVIGVVFAVTGYLVHEVFESVPFMLVDSVEALDADRIAALIEYLEGFARYFVVALLPGDAEAVDSAYPRITEI